MPRLDERLKSVCRQIRGGPHADIGSDHGNLVKALLATRRIEFGIAVENKCLPYLNSQRTLQGWNADVRFGSGLEPIGMGEVDSISICGMGGGTIRKILERSPDKLPHRMVLQPNNRSDTVRDWAWRNRYHLVNEWFTEGSRRFEVFVLASSDGTPDPAYDGLNTEMAIHLGPFHLRRRQPSDAARWREEALYLQSLPQRNEFAERRYRVIKAALSEHPTAETDQMPTSIPNKSPSGFP